MTKVQPELFPVLDDGETLDRTKPLRYSVSLVTQGDHRFYTLTLPSNVLAKTCFVTSREEDPEKGFQRVLSTERAKQIADYIDTGLGTIPSSIVLSAQPAAQLKDIGKGKTIEFLPDPKAFLVIDGQHRVYGFSLAKTRLRVPVVIYNNLSKRTESRLFIDINTKQKPVPNELLLDIKKLAEYESDAERICGELYDMFHEQQSSPLLGLTSAIARAPGKLSRVTFNSALRPLLPLLETSSSDDIYAILAEYLRAVKACLESKNVGRTITNPIVFRSILIIFPNVAGRIKDRSLKYTVDHFMEILKPTFQRIMPRTLLHPRNVTDLSEKLTKAAQRDFTL